MAASPELKIYDKHGTYQAAVKEPEAGALLMSMYGDGATIRLGHTRVLWHEGHEKMTAAESYDSVAIAVKERLALFRRAQYLRVYGENK